MGSGNFWELTGTHRTHPGSVEGTGGAPYLQSKFGSSVVIQQFVRSSGCKPWMIRSSPPPSPRPPSLRVSARLLARSVPVSVPVFLPVTLPFSLPSFRPFSVGPSLLAPASLPARRWTEQLCRAARRGHNRALQGRASSLTGTPASAWAHMSTRPGTRQACVITRAGTQRACVPAARGSTRPPTARPPKRSFARRARASTAAWSRCVGCPYP